MSKASSADINQNKLFRGVAAEALEEIGHIPTYASYRAGEVIIDEGDPADSVFLILSGEVHISKRGRGGRQESLSFLQAGDFFGEMALYDPAPRSAQACAATDVRVAQLDRDGFQRALELAPRQICDNMTRVIIQRLRQLDSRLIDELMQAERLSLIGSMASSIMHDLRNPLSVILGATQLLEGDTTDPALLRYPAMIRRSVDRIMTMTTELLEFSRGRSVLQLTVVSVYDLVEELDEQVLSRLEAEGIRVERRIAFSGDLVVDRSRFVRMLLNIIRNAGEAMKGGGLLELVIEEVGEDIRLSVADTGVGIPQELLGRIFEPFVTHGKEGGTGLGMAIAKSVVEAHQGRIEVASTIGVGTCFTITVPRIAPVLREPTSAVAASQ